MSDDSEKMRKIHARLSAAEVLMATAMAHAYQAGCWCGRGPGHPLHHCPRCTPDTALLDGDICPRCRWGG